LNRQKFIDLLRDPSEVKPNEVQELEQVVRDYPYFQSARILLAKIKHIEDPKKASKYISSAAVHVADRVLLKQYLADQLFFLEPKPEIKERPAKKRNEVKGPPSEKKQAKPQKSAPDRVVPKNPKPSPDQHTNQSIAKETESPEAPSDIDKLIAEIYQDLEDLKASKARFNEIERKLEEDEAVDEALKQVTKDSLKQDKQKNQDEKPTGAKESESPDIEEEKKAFEKEWAKDADTESGITTRDDSKETKREAKPSPGKVKKSENVSQVKPEASDNQESTTEKTNIEKSERDKEVTAVDDTTRKKDSKVEVKKVDKSESEKDKETETVEDDGKAKPTRKSTSTKKSTTSKTTAKKTSTTSRASTKSEEKTSTKRTASRTTKKTASSRSTKTTPDVDPKKSSSSDQTKSTSSARQKNKRKSDDGTEPISKRSRGERVQEEPKIKDSEDQKKIISEFIEKDPEITRPVKPNKGEKSDLSAKSTRFHADIASEYLAEIYIEQGKYSRAIEIYENLILKFPEKQSFFADRIADLKKK
jgi:tetratricopeptide (TPR) repeat protein